MSMTYRQLVLQLTYLNQEQLDSDIVIYDKESDECCTVLLNFLENDPRLNENHPVFQPEFLLPQSQIKPNRK